MQNAEVDIIIPVYNQKKLTIDCLESIHKHSDLPHRIILIDNGSDIETKNSLEEYKKKSENIIVLRNEENLGWVKAVNQGIKASAASYICIMNNDTVVRTSGWLSKLIGIFAMDDAIGLINPCFEIKGSAPKDKAYLEVDFCRGYCILMKRKVTERVGLLDESYGLGYYDDDDYSMRAVDAGFRCVKANGVTVEHLRDSTFAFIFPEKERRALHENNKQLFYSKWGRKLKIVFVITGSAAMDKLQGILINLARRQHKIYLWRSHGPRADLWHLNIKERKFPDIFSNLFFSLALYVNHAKKKERHYDAIFVDSAPLHLRLSRMGINVHYTDLNTIKEIVNSVSRI